MAEEQTLKRRAMGLFTHPNSLELPPGALTECWNGVIDREYVIQKRRGFKRYGDALDAAALGMFEYRKRLVVLDGDKLKYDSDGLGTWLPWDGHFQQAELGLRLRALETNGNVYWPTLKGIYANDALDGVPYRAGAPQGLDLQVELTGTGLVGILDPGEAGVAVGYRVIWGREDANGNLITGAPSWTETIINPVHELCAAAQVASATVTVTLADHGYATNDWVVIADGTQATFGSGLKQITVTGANTFTYTGTGVATVSGTLTVSKFHNVEIEFTVPDEITTGWFYEIYRTDTVTAGVEVGERFKRVVRKDYVSGDTITYTDEIDQEDLDLPLYTNDTLEGPSQENSRPGFARFVALYKTHTFYGFCRVEQFLEFQFDSVDGIVDDTDTITISAGTPLTYTFGTAEDQANRKFERSTDPDEGRELTMKSFCKIVNRDPDSNVTAYYISGSEEASGKVELRHKYVDAGMFTVDSTVGDHFTPDLSSPVGSEVDLEENVICRSKAGQPEHVPIGNKHRIGKKNKAILGLSVNRDALFIYKEDGIFTLSGESDGGGGFNFSVTEYDPTVLLAGWNTLVTLDNSSYSLTTQGGVRVTQSSSSIFSRQVENEILRQVRHGSFFDEAFGVEYESDRKYLLFHEGKIYCYNYLTNAWSIWLLDASHGHVLAPEDHDRLYVAHTFDPYILQERKSGAFSLEDYQDEEFTVTVDDSPGGTFQGKVVSVIDVTYSEMPKLTAGWSFSQNTTLLDAQQAIVEEVEDLGGGSYRLTLSKLITVQLATEATIAKPIPLRVAWSPESRGSAGTMKQFPGFQIYQENDDARHTRLGFMADHQTAFEYVEVIRNSGDRGWGVDEWGTTPWGSPKAGRSTPVRTSVPLAQQRARCLATVYENKYAKEQVTIVEAAVDVRAYGTRTERSPE